MKGYSKILAKTGMAEIESLGSGEVNFKFLHDGVMVGGLTFDIFELENIVKHAKQHSKSWSARFYYASGKKIMVGDHVTTTSGRYANKKTSGVIVKIDRGEAYIDFARNIRDDDGCRYPDAYWCKLEYLTEVK